jgi:hypothetical protein
VKRVYRVAVAGFAVTFLGIGVALIVVTAVHGGGIGYLLGALFVAAGTARLYLLFRGTHP